MDKTGFNPSNGAEYPKDFPSSEDFWILHQREKEYKIRVSAAWLLDNLLPWILEINSRGNLPKNREVKMSLYRQKKSKNYWINVSFRGERTRVSSRCSSKRDAERVESLLLAKVIGSIFPVTPQNNVPPLEPVSPTFVDASEQYLKDMCEGKKIACNREELCHKDLIPFFGERRIDQITSKLVLEWRGGEIQRIVRGGKKISPRSANYNLGYLKRFFNYAIDVQEWLKENPATKIRPLKENNKRERVLSEDEEQRLPSVCERDWFKRVLIFGIETGLRISEIASLRTGDFHLDYGIPHFKKAREKNTVSTEFPIVSERLATVIQEQMSACRTTDHFFVDEKGCPVSRYNIDYWFRRAKIKAGIEGLIFHDLRRTFCSRLNWLGCNKMFIEYLMGHTVKGIESHYLAHNLVRLQEELIRVEEIKKNRVIPLSYLEQEQDVSFSAKTVETVVGQGAGGGS